MRSSKNSPGLESVLTIIRRRDDADNAGVAVRKLLPPDFFATSGIDNPALAFALGQIVSAIESSQLIEVSIVDKLDNIIDRLEKLETTAKDTEKKVKDHGTALAAVSTAITRKQIVSSIKFLVPLTIAAGVLGQFISWLWKHFHT